MRKDWWLTSISTFYQRSFLFLCRALVRQGFILMSLLTDTVRFFIFKELFSSLYRLIYIWVFSLECLGTMQWVIWDTRVRRLVYLCIVLVLLINRLFRTRNSWTFYYCPHPCSILEQSKMPERFNRG